MLPYESTQHRQMLIRVDKIIVRYLHTEKNVICAHNVNSF